MKSEAELRQLLADIDTVNEDSYVPGGTHNVFDAFRNGISAGLAEALDLDVERCGNPDCHADHKAARIDGLNAIRERAAAIRAARATRARTTLQ